MVRGTKVGLVSALPQVFSIQASVTTSLLCLPPIATLTATPITAAKMLIPKADRKKIHESLFREGVLVAPKK